MQQVERCFGGDYIWRISPLVEPAQLLEKDGSQQNEGTHSQSCQQLNVENTPLDSVKR